MAPSASSERTLGDADAEVLLDIANGAVLDGLAGLAPSAPHEDALPEALREHRGVFITLTVDGALNGCIGAVQATEPLGHGAARHAWSAAFADPRLPSLRPADYQRLTVEASVLSVLTPVPATSRAVLLETLRPGVDGLLIAAGSRQGVFLPAVWNELGEPALFLDHLCLKAGVPAGVDVPGLRAWRFTAERFGRRAGERANPSRAA